jgi:hypothetical protein
MSGTSQKVNSDAPNVKANARAPYAFSSHTVD